MNTSQILQRGGGLVRDGVRLAERLGRRVASDAYGVIKEAQHMRPAAKPEMDDATLAHKVQSEIFRGTRIAKSSVNVNVVDGVVWLRGELKRPEQIRRLEERARAIPEVRGVENLLHLPRTPAPTRADTPKRQQRTRSSTRRPTPRRTAGRISDDRTDAIAREGEPAPAEHARARRGRTPAPLGARESAPSAARPATEGASVAAGPGAGQTDTPATAPTGVTSPEEGSSTSS